MKICKRCYQETVGIHTCSPKFTKCCNDRAVILAGRHKFDPEDDKEFTVGRGRTYHYACKKCNEPCDLVYGERE